MKHLHLFLALGAVAVLAGCGGGGGSRGTGRASIVINWPAPSRLIPAAANVIKIDVTGGPTTVPSKVVPRPTGGETTTTTTFDSLGVGDYTVTASAYPQDPGTQSTAFTAVTAQATGSVPMHIAVGQNTAVTITMATTIKKVDIAPSPDVSVGTGNTVTLTATARDATGAVVLTTPGTLQWASSNAPLATVDNNGVLSGWLPTDPSRSRVCNITVTEKESGVVSAPVNVNVTVVGSGLYNNSPWPKYRADLRNTGRGGSAASTATTGQRSWMYATNNGFITSSPVIGAGRVVYVGAYDGKLYAVNPDGTLRWTFDTGGGIPSTGTSVVSSPAIGADGTIYIGANNGRLYAIDPYDHKAKWYFTTAGPISSSPTISADGTVYVGGTDGKVYAIDPNGSQRWVFDTNSDISNQYGAGTTTQIVSSPAIGADGSIVIATRFGNVYALDPATGAKSWAFAIPGIDKDHQVLIEASPAVGQDGTIYIGAYNSQFYAISPTTHAAVWNYVTSSQIDASAAIASDGTIYVGNWARTLYAFTPTGTRKWYYTTGARIESSPAVAPDGTVYFGSDDSNVYALNPSGSLKWSHATGSLVISSPAIGVDGTVFIGSEDSNLYALH